MATMTTVLAHRLSSIGTTSLRIASRRQPASLNLQSVCERIARFYSVSRPVALADAATAPASADSAADSGGAEDRPFASPRVEDLFHRMKTLDRDDLNTISELVNERLGIVLTPEMFTGGRGGTEVASGDEAAVEEEKAEEKTVFDLKLVAFDAKSKIKVIKEVRSMAGLGLKEAKELVEGAPKVVKKDIKKEEAEELKAKLEEVGATVEIS